MSCILFVPSCGIEPVNLLTRCDTLIRCQEGFQEWNTGKYDFLLLTGGIFLPKEVQTISASLLMKKFFVERGVPEEKILTEELSVDTFENVLFVLELLKQKNIRAKSIFVLSQWQHALRIWVIFFLAHRKIVHIIPLFYKVSWRTNLNEMKYLLYTLYDRRGDRKFAQKIRAGRRFPKHIQK